MLNKYETSAYWTKKTINGTVLFTNWKIQTIITWKEYKNLQQTNHITLKDILFVLPNCVLLDVLTSEDGVKHWYEQSHV
jgi:hypothetical protein